MSSREVTECSWVWPIRLYKCHGTWQSSPGVVVDLPQPIPKPYSVSAPQRKIVEVYRTLWRLCLVEPEASSGEKVFWILGIWGFGCSMIYSWKSSCWKISGCWGSIEIGFARQDEAEVSLNDSACKKSARNGFLEAPSFWWRIVATTLEDHNQLHSTTTCSAHTILTTYSLHGLPMLDSWYLEGPPKSVFKVAAQHHTATWHDHARAR